MKVVWRNEIPLWILIAAMFCWAALSWQSAPNQIPVHWGIDGQVDRYGGKFEGLLLLPLVAVGVYFMMLMIPRLDPGRLNYPGFAGPYLAIRIGIVAFLSVIYAVTQMALRGRPVDMTRVIPLLVGLLLILVGGVMGKIRPNWFVGIRTPWTLSSKLAWVRTHRLGGWVLVLGGIALTGVGLTGSPTHLVWVIGAMVAGMLWTVVYSFLVWRKDPERIPPAGTLPSE